LSARDLESPVALSLDDDFLADPHQCLANWRETGPVQRVVIPDGRECWVVTRYSDVVDVLSGPDVSCDLSPDRSASNPFSPEVAEAFRSIRQGLFINMDPPDHTRLRKLVVREFSARRVEALRPLVQETADRLLDALDGKESVDLVEAFTYALPIAVLCALIGIPDADRKKFRMWTKQALSFVGDSQEAHQVVAAVNSFYEYFGELLRAKRRQPSDDLLSALVRTTDVEESISEKELAGVALLLFVAGHETTSHSLALGVLSLLGNPRQYAVVRDDPTAMSSYIDELLRYDGPSTPGVFRYTTADIDVGGVTIPAGSWVLAAIAAANRDPARFEAPNSLDLEREDNQHVAFGRGIHYCLGAALAKAMVEIGLGTLFQRYPHIELAVPMEQLKWRRGYMRALEEFPVRLGAHAA
jgi:6-deoxyerythronolide B hydroxylase